MRKKIHVTAEDIELGTPYSVDSCPIALAIRRETGIAGAVGRETVRVRVRFDRIIRLPRAATRFIPRFDSYREVKPFNFFLEVPE